MESRNHARILIDRHVVLLGAVARGASPELLATCKLYGPGRVRLFIPSNEMQTARVNVEKYIRRRALPRTAAHDIEQRFRSLELDRQGLVEIVPFDVPRWVEPGRNHVFLPAVAASVGADLVATYCTTLRMQEGYLGTTIASPAACLGLLFDLLDEDKNDDPT